MSTWIGKTLGKVYIDSLLARGGMAEVYLGTHTTLQREVAVKILRSFDEDHPVLLERFQRGRLRDDLFDAFLDAFIHGLLPVAAVCLTCCVAATA